MTPSLKAFPALASEPAVVMRAPIIFAIETAAIPNTAGGGMDEHASLGDRRPTSHSECQAVR